MLLYVLYGSALIAASALLIALHRRSLRDARRDGADSADGQFAHRQFRRRVTTSALLGLVGVAMIVGYWLPASIVSVYFWGVVMLVVLIIMILAVIDLLKTRRHYAELQQANRRRQGELESQIDQMRTARSNGHGKVKTR